MSASLSSLRSRKPRSTGHRLVTLALVLAAPLGCATTKPAAPDVHAAATLERMRAENAAQLRRVEELENQVFVLTSELEARRGGTPPAPAAPVLPEVKLSRAQRDDNAAERAAETDRAAERAARPESLVDETEVEYAGAAAERSAGKRPVLRLWGQGETGAAEEVAEAEAPEPRTRERHRAALSRRAPHPELPPARALPAPVAAASGAPKVAKAANVATPAKAEPARPDQELYQAALVHLRAGRHEEAVAALRGFVAAHPQHDLADNAQYWLGECFYDRKDYSTALREFRRVADDFPNGNKVPDALLKLGLSYLALGSTRPAQEALADLVRRFPRHPASALAEAKLAALPAAQTAALSPPRLSP